MPRISRRVNDCPHLAATIALKRLGGRWKVLILQELMVAPKRFSELQRSLPCTSPKMLTQQLKELEADALLVRTEIQTNPPKVVEYRLSPLGESARKLIEAMVEWGRLAASSRQLS